MPELICLGELVIDFCATVADVSVGEAPGFAKGAGGAPANVAVAARRLGAETGFIGAVGDDPFGAFLADVLASEGVDTTGLTKLPGTKTPLAFVAARSDGTGDFFFYHDGGLAPLREEFIDESYVGSASALHFGSISRIEPAARAATDKARAVAGRNGLLVSYDPNYRRRLWADQRQARDRIREGFAGTDVVKISGEEWEFLLGTDDLAGGEAVVGCRRVAGGPQRGRRGRRLRHGRRHGSRRWLRRRVRGVHGRGRRIRGFAAGRPGGGGARGCRPGRP